MYKIRSGPDYTTPIDPQNTQLVFLDYDQGVNPQASRCLQNVLLVAQTGAALGIPALITLFKSARALDTLTAALTGAIDRTAIVERQQVNIWSDGGLRKRLEKASLPKLVFLSAVAGTALCLSALGSLRENYDVYVVWDSVLGGQPGELDTLRQRLTQAGVIPLTTALLIGELTLNPAQDYVRVS